MQRSGSMRFQLRCDADGRVSSVDKNHQLIGILHARRATTNRYLEILGVSFVQIRVSSKHLTSLIPGYCLTQDRLNANEEHFHFFRWSAS